MGNLRKRSIKNGLSVINWNKPRLSFGGKLVRDEVICIKNGEVTMRILTALSAVIAATGVAQAGQVDTLGDTSGFMADYVSAYGAGNYAINWHTSLSAGSGNFSSFSNNTGTSFTFDSLAGAVNPSENGNFMVNIMTDPGTDFYYGDTDNLRDIDFDGGDEARPTHNSLAVAFGNNAWTSNEVRMSFVPGVTAFGFNYEDIGDVGGTLEVLFSNGITETITTAGASSSPDRDGFMWAVAASGTTIDSITFSQLNSSANDGFIFYDFATIQVVPLPAPVLAGLGMLGALGVARRIRQK